MEGPDKHPIRARIKYITSPMALVDILAILPFYLPLFVQVDLRYLRALRLFRMVRILKLGRYSKSMKKLGEVFHDKAPDLVITTVVGVVLLTFSAGGMYYFEHKAQPEVFSSIPAAMWWAISTLTHCGLWRRLPHYCGRKGFRLYCGYAWCGPGRYTYRNSWCRSRREY